MQAYEPQKKRLSFPSFLSLCRAARKAGDQLAEFERLELSLTCN
jgi:hypothetical protein